MHDLLPDVAQLYRRIEDATIAVLDAYGYREIRLPLAEDSELFQRSIGAGTDIIDKEMYHLQHSSSENHSQTRLSLRPEGTAGCLRAAIQHGLIRGGARLWYQGAMFRHERPQKGRFRQFQQIGVETIGFGGVETDAELLSLGSALWRRLGVEECVHLEINSLGSSAARQRYREALVAFLTPRASELDADSQKRLAHNPLRILDSKNRDTQLLLKQAPRLEDYWSEEDSARFAGLQDILDAMKIEYRVNTRLVRGLDYYGGLVFEWLSKEGGAQNALAAGGRYDDLVVHLGAPAAPAAGFAVGMERLGALVAGQTNEQDEALSNADDACVIASPESLSVVMGCVEELRQKVPAARLLGPVIASEKAQLRRARNRGVALVLSCELHEQRMSWRVYDMRKSSDAWQTLTTDALCAVLGEQVKIRHKRSN